MNITRAIEALEALPVIQKVLYGSLMAAQNTHEGVTPRVYVAPFKEIATDTITANRVLQMVTRQFEVVLVSSYGQFDEARTAILSALIGLELQDDAVDLVEQFESEQVDATATEVFWRDVFQDRVQRRFP